jgi:tetratricopeptide (TPR) repeat protein
MKSLFKIAAAVAVFVFAATASTVRADNKEDAARLGKEGLDAAKAKDWEKAVTSLKKATELDGANPNYGFNLALAQKQRGLGEMQQEKFDAAIADLSEALKKNPDDAVSLRFRAFAYLKKSDWKNALADYDAALKKKHDDPEPLSRRAFVHMQLKDYDKAIADYSAVIKLKPDDAASYLSRANAYEFKSDMPKAIADYDKVLQLQPGNADAQNRRTLLQKAAASGASPAAPSPAAPPPK